MSVGLERLSKVQLHCHLEGTVREETFCELAREAGLVPRPYAFGTFGEFLLLFAEVCKALRTPEGFARIAREYVADAATHGVRYAELFVSPSVWTWFHRELDVRAVMAAIRSALDEAGAAQGIEIAMIADLTRNFGVERAEATSRLAVSLRDLGVIGIGLGGDEANYPPAPYARAFAIAREGGLHAVAHAGEAAGAHSVRDAVELLGAERIGHGVRAIEDPAVVALLAERRIPLEICPTSNRLTGAAPYGAPHPLAALDAAGCVVTIDADDPALFGTTISGEYAAVEAQLGRAAVERFAANAIEASFAPESLKARLRAELAASRNSVRAGRTP